MSTAVPMFWCMRCQAKLLERIEAKEQQLTLQFEGGVRYRVAIYRNNQPVQVSSVVDSGPSLGLTTASGQTINLPMLHLFELLQREEQIWNI